MATNSRQSPTRAAYWRKLIVLAMVVIALVAFYAQANPPLPRTRTVVIYVSREVIFARTLDGEWERAVLPLYPECALHWSEGERGGSMYLHEMAFPLDTGTWLPDDAQVALTYPAEGDLFYEAGFPHVTVRAANTSVNIWTVCP